MDAVKHGLIHDRRRAGGIGEFGHYVHRMFKPYGFRGLRLTAPNQGFSGERAINLQGVDIVLSEVGPGHTDGDCIVYIPDEKAVYAADIVFVDATPVVWAGPVDKPRRREPYHFSGTIG
jgi:cyclase